MKRIFLLSAILTMALGIPLAFALCPYIPGDVNGNGQTNGIDVTFAVGYFKGGAVPPIHCDMCPQPIPFYAAGDVNGNCVFNGQDITFMINFLGGGPGQIEFCPSCPPDVR